MVVRPVDPLPCICLLFSVFSNVYHFTCIWPRALKLGCMTNVDMLFLTTGFICLSDENKFMLISSGHTFISNRSVWSVRRTYWEILPFFVWRKWLRFKNQPSPWLQTPEHFLKHHFETSVTPVKMNPLGHTQTQNRVVHWLLFFQHPFISWNIILLSRKSIKVSTSNKRLSRFRILFCRMHAQEFFFLNWVWINVGPFF